MRDALLILSVVLGLNAMASSTPPADQSIEQIAEAPKFVDPSPVEVPKAKSPYAIAWETAQTTGKLAVFVKMERCEPCEKALPLFTELVASGGYAAVVLDMEKDSELVGRIGKSGIAPQVIVYEKRDGEWFQRSVVGNKTRDIQIALAGKNPGAGGVSILSTPAPGRSSCSCDSCPRDCEANGCDCSVSKSAASGSCSSCGESRSLPRFFRGRR